LGVIGNKTYHNIVAAAEKFDVEFTVSTVWNGKFQKDVAEYIEGIWAYRENIESFFILYKFEFFMVLLAFILCVAVLVVSKKRTTFWIMITFCMGITVAYEIVGWNKMVNMQELIGSFSGLMSQFQKDSVSALMSLMKGEVINEIGSAITVFTAFRDFYVCKISFEMIAAVIAAVNLFLEKEI